LKPSLTPLAKYTFYYHLRAIFFEGFFTGVWLLNDVVARKHFLSSPFLLTLLVMAPSASLILSLPLGSIMGSKPKRNFFLLAGCFRFSFLLVPFCRSPFMFVVLTSVAAISYPIFFTGQNAILKENYGDKIRGRLFGIIYSFSGFIAILTSLSIGKLYDVYPDSPSIIYPFAAVMGFLSCFFFAKIKGKISVGEKNPLINPLEILRKRPDFRRFEISYFLYGTGFMMMLPLLPLYLVDHLKVTYSQASFLNGLFYQGMIVIFSWFMGRSADRIHALHLNRAGFIGLILYPILLAVAPSVFWAYPAYAWYGISMAVVNVTWYLAPLTFCRMKEEATSFVALHVALAGVRSFIAFPLGTLLYSVSGTFTVPFLTASLLFLISTFVLPTPAKIINPAK
jgi:MFS family permease